MGPTPFYGARAEKNPQKADFAMKQMNICRLSGDIITTTKTVKQKPQEIEVIFSCVVVHLTSSDTDINRVSKELPTGEVLSTRMLVYKYDLWLKHLFWIEYGLFINDGKD